MDQILTYGRVIRPTLGITVAPPQMLGRLNLSGVLVMDVNPDSPAAMAGVQGCYRDFRGRLVLGDVIVGSAVFLFSPTLNNPRKWCHRPKATGS